MIKDNISTRIVQQKWFQRGLFARRFHEGISKNQQPAQRRTRVPAFILLSHDMDQDLSTVAVLATDLE